jgi:AraC-like DNA-binding protein
MNGFTDSVWTLRGVLGVLEQHGVDPDPVLTAAGIRRGSLDDTHLRLPMEQVKSGLRAAVHICHDRFLGLHAAETVRFGSFGTLDYICQTAPTASAAFQRLCAYYSLVNDSVILEAERGLSDCALCLGSQLGKPLPQMVDFILASIVLHTRWCWRMDWVPGGVELPYPEPEETAEYERIFRCELRFDRPVARLLIPLALWDAPIPTSDPDLLMVLEERASTLLALQPPPHDIEARVRTLIGSNLSDGNVDLDSIAAELGFSPRNLQRQLKSVHRSFSQIHDDIRAQAAMYYLRNPDFPVGEIAGKVGYLETSSFTRAFRRWTGTTPGEYRRYIASHL